LDSETTSSSKTCPKPTKSKSLEVLPWLCIKGNFLDHVMLPWLKAESQIPSTMCVCVLVLRFQGAVILSCDTNC
jgi:hypothetical protein